MVFPDFIASGEYPGDPGYDTSAQVRASTCMEGAICLDYYFELPADVTTADPIAYSPYVYIDEPKFEAAVSVEMDIILEDPIPPGRRELHDDEADKRPLPLVAALKQDLAWLASSGSRRVKPDDVMVSVSMESSGLGLDGVFRWTEKVTATIQGMRSAHHAKMVSEELADWAASMEYDDCIDTDNGATDSDDYGCADGYSGFPGYCGGYDDQDFTSRAMCCACGGGSTTGLFADTEESDEAKGLFADKFPHVDQMIEHLSEEVAPLTLAGVKSIFVSEAFILEDAPGKATGEPVVVRPTEGVVGAMPLEICDGEPGHHLDCILYQCTTYSFPDMPPQCAVKSHPGYDDAVVSVSFGLTLTDVGPAPSTESEVATETYNFRQVATRMATFLAYAAFQTWDGVPADGIPWDTDSWYGKAVGDGPLDFGRHGGSLGTHYFGDEGEAPAGSESNAPFSLREDDLRVYRSSDHVLRIGIDFHADTPEIAAAAAAELRTLHDQDALVDVLSTLLVEELAGKVGEGLSPGMDDVIVKADHRDPPPYLNAFFYELVNRLEGLGGLESPLMDLCVEIGGGCGTNLDVLGQHGPSRPLGYELAASPDPPDGVLRLLEEVDDLDGDVDDGARRLSADAPTPSRRPAALRAAAGTAVAAARAPHRRALHPIDAGSCVNLHEDCVGRAERGHCYGRSSSEWMLKMCAAATAHAPDARIHPLYPTRGFASAAPHAHPSPAPPPPPGARSPAVCAAAPPSRRAARACSCARTGTPSASRRSARVVTSMKAGGKPPATPTRASSPRSRTEPSLHPVTSRSAARRSSAERCAPSSARPGTRRARSPTSRPSRSGTAGMRRTGRIPGTSAC